LAGPTSAYNPYATVRRLEGSNAILDADNNFNQVEFLQFAQDSPDQ
jgi:hypothetical protein